jgi:hypothetical protein
LERTNKKGINMDYYQAPSQEIFDSIKNGAIKIWSSYDDTYGYASEKINQIKDLENIRDNAWTIVAMFDQDNQRKLLDLVSPGAVELIMEIRGY